MKNNKTKNDFLLTGEVALKDILDINSSCKIF